MGKAKKKNKPLRRRMIKFGKRRKAHLQVGALCFSETEDGLRFLLITSRRTRRWIIPKGWTMKKLSKRQAALREAWEEAGVEGTVVDKAVGIYTYRKMISPEQTIRCAVQTYPVEVTRLADDFPEKGERKLRWFKAGKAAKLASDPKLGQLIKSFEKAYGASSKAKKRTSAGSIDPDADNPSIELKSTVSIP